MLCAQVWVGPKQSRHHWSVSTHSGSAVRLRTPMSAFCPRHPIALASYRLDCIEAQLHTQASDKDFDGVRLAIKILRIDVIENLGARDNFAGAMHEDMQEPPLRRGEIYSLATPCDDAASRVECER